MTLQKRSILTPLILATLLCLTFALGCTPRTLMASNLLPNVSPKMEEPEFWIKKTRNPGRLLLTLEEIQKMNEENLKREGLFLCRVKDLKEEWTREEILALLDEDWEGFGRTAEIRYGRNGVPLDDFFWSNLKTNLSRDSIGVRNQISFGLIVKRTDIRVFPTEELSMSTPDNYEFDRFQHSSVSPGSLVGIYSFSKDKLWTYVQTRFIRGWVRTIDLAIAKERAEAVDYEETKDRLMITGSFVKVFGDSLFQQPVFVAQMGTSFPILNWPQTTPAPSGYRASRVRGKSPGEVNQCYMIKIPFRESDGRLSFRKGYIPGDEDIHLGFLPYTQENLARQAFKMLHQPYGWGEMFGARDCSRFILDLFSTFGILMPRNSKLQARIGVPLGPVEGKTIKEKQKVLDHATPLATLLRLPGHIMLYLGSDSGRYFVIHSIWGIQRGGWFGPKLQQIGKVVVSDLSLGKTGPNQSLLHRITDIQLIGPVLEAPRQSPLGP